MTNKPTKKFECGAVSVAIWNNEIETANGPKSVEKVTVERRYTDKDGQWKSTGSFAVGTDLPKLILALQKAYEHVSLRRGNGDEDEESGGSE